MSKKMTCPACDSYTSSVLRAFEDGEPCPYCGLPASAASAVLAAERRHADAELVRKYTEAAQRAAKAEARVRWLERLLLTVRNVAEEYQRGPDSDEGAS